MENKSFDLQPTLVGALLKLRPLTSEDFEELYQSASDPEIWEQHPQFDRYKKEVFQKFFTGAIDSQGAFAILDLQSGKIIGSSRYYGHDQIKNQILIGYTFLQKKYWGGKFNGELKSLMLGHAFQFVGAALFEIGENNKRSRKAIEKMGAQLCSEAVLHGKAHVVYKISKPTV